VKFNAGDEVMFTFTNALQADRLRLRLRAPHVKRTFTPTNAVEFCIFALASMPVWSFLLADAEAASVFQEDTLQKGFAMALALCGFAFQPEVAVRAGRRRRRGRPPAVDFVVRAGGSTSAIELLCDAETNKQSLACHCNRFVAIRGYEAAKNGQMYRRYAGDFCVVSFQMEFDESCFVGLDEAVSKNVLVVTPHPARGWSVLCVHRMGRDTVHVPRTGVPVKPDGNVAQEHVPDALATVWVQPTGNTRGSAFKVAPASNDIDGLKDAIKAKKNPELNQIAADRLIIRKAGGEEELGPKEALVPGVEYSYEAPTSRLGSGVPVKPDGTAAQEHVPDAPPQQHEFVVFDKSSGSAFRVEPKHADVMGLKKAIKAEAELAGPAHLLVIRKAGGKEQLGPTEALLPGVDYSYEVPK
jgi:hypothetical protein